MFNQRLHVVFFCLGILAGSGTVYADLILGLQTSQSLTVTSGETRIVDLVITDNDNSSPLEAEGLQNAGGRILKNSGGANAMVTAITDVMGYWGGGGLFDTNPASSGSGAELAKVSTLLDFAALTGAGAGSTSITIARFAFQINGAGGSTVQLLADRLNLSPFVGNTTFGPLEEDLDDFLTFGSLTFTVDGTAAVPEPASMILASLTAAVAGGGSYLRRRRLKKSVG